MKRANEMSNYINSLEEALELLEARNNAGHEIDMQAYLNLNMELIEEAVAYGQDDEFV